MGRKAGLGKLIEIESVTFEWCVKHDDQGDAFAEANASIAYQDEKWRPVSTGKVRVFVQRDWNDVWPSGHYNWDNEFVWGYDVVIEGVAFEQYRLHEISSFGSLMNLATAVCVEKMHVACSNEKSRRRFTMLNVDAIEKEIDKLEAKYSLRADGA